LALRAELREVGVGRAVLLHHDDDVIERQLFGFGAIQVPSCVGRDTLKSVAALLVTVPLAKLMLYESPR